MNTIIINGSHYSGDTITVNNGKVFVNGKDVTSDQKQISIQVTGNVETLSVDACNEVSVTGEVGFVKTMSGDVSVNDVKGDVSTISGDVHARVINGKVKTISGDIIK